VLSQAGKTSDSTTLGPITCSLVLSPTEAAQEPVRNLSAAGDQPPARKPPALPFSPLTQWAPSSPGPASGGASGAAQALVLGIGEAPALGVGAVFPPDRTHAKAPSDEGSAQPPLGGWVRGGSARERAEPAPPASLDEAQALLVQQWAENAALRLALGAQRAVAARRAAAVPQGGWAAAELQDGRKQMARERSEWAAERAVKEEAVRVAEERASRAARKVDELARRVDELRGELAGRMRAEGQGGEEGDARAPPSQRGSQGERDSPAGAGEEAEMIQQLRRALAEKEVELDQVAVDAEERERIFAEQWAEMRSEARPPVPPLPPCARAEMGGQGADAAGTARGQIQQLRERLLAVARPLSAATSRQHSRGASPSHGASLAPPQPRAQGESYSPRFHGAAVPQPSTRPLENPSPPAPALLSSPHHPAPPPLFSPNDSHAHPDLYTPVGSARCSPRSRALPSTPAYSPGPQQPASPRFLNTSHAYAPHLSPRRGSAAVGGAPSLPDIISTALSASREPSPHPGRLSPGVHPAAAAAPPWGSYVGPGPLLVSDRDAAAPPLGALPPAGALIPEAPGAPGEQGRPSSPRTPMWGRGPRAQGQGGYVALRDSAERAPSPRGASHTPRETMAQSPRPAGGPGGLGSRGEQPTGGDPKRASGEGTIWSLSPRGGGDGGGGGGGEPEEDDASRPATPRAEAAPARAPAPRAPSPSAGWYGGGGGGGGGGAPDAYRSLTAAALAGGRAEAGRAKPLRAEDAGGGRTPEEGPGEAGGGAAMEHPAAAPLADLQLQSDDGVQAEMPSPDAARPAGAGAAPGAESPVSDVNDEWEL
jgi:hypothetical protein